MHRHTDTQTCSSQYFASTPADAVTTEKTKCTKRDMYFENVLNRVDSVCGNTIHSVCGF